MRAHYIFKCPRCEGEVRRVLTARKSKTCGCQHRERKHPENSRKIARVWANMKKRCRNKATWNYKRYGGRGIKVCEEWQEFIPFYKWVMKNGYCEGKQIDRIDNNGGYYPENCRIVDPTVNARNKSNTRLSIEKVKVIRELYRTGKKQAVLSEMYSVSRQLIWQVVHNKIWV